MSDEETDLTIRRTEPDRESYRIAFHHPDHGSIDVGSIAQRAGASHQAEQWHWSIGWSTLPGRHWREGNAVTMKAASAAWKSAWPGFRDARSEADWHDAKASQDMSEKKLMISDARQLPNLTRDELAELTAELGRPGPAPHWLEQLLARGRGSRA